MPVPTASHLLLVVLVVALVAWRLHARLRRMVGRQRLSILRPWLTGIVLPLVLALILATRLLPALAALAAAAGAALGIVLGLLGTRLTRFEATPAGLFYTPNAHLGIALSLLLVLRIGYRVTLLALTGQALDAPSLQLGSSPLTLAICGTLAGYYVTYAIGLLRWRTRAGREASAEH